MGDLLYSILELFGYGHPLHPVLTHMVIGPVIAALLLGLTAWVFNKPVLYKTARHMTVLGFIAWFPTVAVGVIDWVHFYNASPNMIEIVIKSALAGVLFVSLLMSIMVNRKVKEDSKLPLLLYAVSAVSVGVIGYFGGNLVFSEGTKSSETSGAGIQVTQTAQGFNKVETQGYLLEWKVNGAHLDVKMGYKTTGWVAVGFGHSGTMKDSDIYIGYIKDGKPVIEDDFGYARYKHAADTDKALKGVSNVTNISGSEENGYTTLSFSIPLNSGDTHDVVLTPGDTYDIIMAYAPNGAKDLSSYHGRGGHIAFKVKL